MCQITLAVFFKQRTYNYHGFVRLSSIMSPDSAFPLIFTILKVLLKQPGQCDYRMKKPWLNRQYSALNGYMTA